MASNSNRKREQHIAVFGESGSGKTVLISSFYGLTQEPAYAEENLFKITSDDSGQGTKLHQSYLQMKNSAQLPAATSFSGSSYKFTVRLKKQPKASPTSSHPFHALQLVWHDYPGEWLETTPENATEKTRRSATFKSLLSSDVAFILVDGQRLLDNAGEEDRYLKLLLNNIRTELASAGEEAQDNAKRLAVFPRIWVFALSKADLLPQLDVSAFRDLMIQKVGGEINQLRDEIKDLIEAPEALSVGDDFMLLSSADFKPGKIDTSKRIGVPLILPVAAALPFERHVKWAKSTMRGAQQGIVFLEGAAQYAAVIAHGAVLLNNLPIPPILKPLVALVTRAVTERSIQNVADLMGTPLREAHARALARHEYLAATLTQFEIDLEEAERAGVVLRSSR